MLSPSMRRPVAVKYDLRPSLFPGNGFLRRVDTVPTLPSALGMSDFRSVQAGCSHFSRRCHLLLYLLRFERIVISPAQLWSRI